MSKSLLQKLYDGEIYPAEKICVRTPEFKELTRILSDEKQYFMNSLTPDEWKKFESIENLQIEKSSAYAFENFTYGFRLGVKLMIEAFGTDKIL